MKQRQDLNNCLTILYEIVLVAMANEGVFFYPIFQALIIKMFLQQNELASRGI
jgi:hypothetical protein